MPGFRLQDLDWSALTFVLELSILPEGRFGSLQLAAQSPDDKVTAYDMYTMVAMSPLVRGWKFLAQNWEAVGPYDSGMDLELPKFEPVVEALRKGHGIPLVLYVTQQEANEHEEEAVSYTHLTLPTKRIV